MFVKWISLQSKQHSLANTLKLVIQLTTAWVILQRLQVEFFPTYEAPWTLGRWLRSPTHFLRGISETTPHSSGTAAKIEWSFASLFQLLMVTVNLLKSTEWLNDWVNAEYWPLRNLSLAPLTERTELDWDSVLVPALWRRSCTDHLSGSEHAASRLQLRIHYFVESSWKYAENFW